MNENIQAQTSILPLAVRRLEVVVLKLKENKNEQDE